MVAFFIWLTVATISVLGVLEAPFKHQRMALRSTGGPVWVRFFTKYMADKSSRHRRQLVGCGVPDPLTPGHCVFVSGSDNLADSTNWGTRTSAVTRPVTAIGTNDPPWLAVTGDPFGQNFGDAVFDPLVSGRL